MPSSYMNWAAGRPRSGSRRPPTSFQPRRRQRRRAHVGADALGQPLHEVGLLGGTHLHGMAHLRHVDAVRADRGGDERGLRPARVDRETAREVAAGSGQRRDAGWPPPAAPTGVRSPDARRARAPASAPAPAASCPARAPRAGRRSAARSPRSSRGNRARGRPRPAQPPAGLPPRRGPRASARRRHRRAARPR